MPVSLRLVLLCSAVWLVSNCGGDGDGGVGPPPDPTVASVEVAPGTLDLAIGQSAQLSATVMAEDGTPLTGHPVAWTTSDPAIATVDGSGLVTGIAAGEANISATSEGKSGTTSVRVAEVSVASVAIVPNPASVAVGQSAQLAAVVTADDGSELPGALVSWSTSDPAIATVSETGLITGVAEGQAIITASSGGQSGTTLLSVSAIPVATVEVTPQSSNLVTGSTVQLSATAKDQAGSVLAGRPATWTSSNAGIARVNPIGRVTAITAGSATITATIEGKAGSATISVSQQPVATVVVSPNPASVAVQQNIQLQATLTAQDGSELTGRAVTWESSNQAVATVTPNGVVRGIAPGSATITARSEGKAGTTALTVTQTLQPVATIEITPNLAILIPVQGTTQLTAVLKAADGTVLTGRSVTWSSNNEAVARVSATGLVTGVAPGSAIITASSEGKSRSTELFVGPISGVVRTWRGGAGGGPSDWSIASNWNPSGKPIALDTARIAVSQSPAVLAEDAQVARLIISGGRLRISGHRLSITAARIPTLISAFRRK